MTPTVVVTLNCRTLSRTANKFSWRHCSVFISCSEALDRTGRGGEGGLGLGKLVSDSMGLGRLKQTLLFQRNNFRGNAKTIVHTVCIICNACDSTD